jgi:hypothetical protein
VTVGSDVAFRVLADVGCCDWILRDWVANCGARRDGEENDV